MKLDWLVLAIGFTTLLPGQDQKPAKNPSGWAPKLWEQPEELEKDAARDAVKEFESAIKSKDADERVEAVKALLAKGRHDSMVKPVGKLLKDREVSVREAGARALGALGYPSALKPLLSSLRHPVNAEAPTLREEAAMSLGRVAERTLVPLIEKDFRSGDQYTKRGLIAAFGLSRDYRAAPLLSDWIERPKPGNVNSDRNPPASYWQERFAEWQYVSPAVGWALFEISGETFKNAEEVDHWVKRKGWRDRVDGQQEKKDDGR